MVEWLSMALENSVGPSQIGAGLLRAREGRFPPDCESSHPCISSMSGWTVTLPPASPLAYPTEIPARVAAASATVYWLSARWTGG